MPSRREPMRIRRPWRGVIAFLSVQLVLLVLFALLRTPTGPVLWVFGLISAVALVFVASVGAPFVKRQLATIEQRNADLEEQRDLLEHIMETSPTGIVVIDVNGKTTRANAMAKQILGLKDSELSTRAYNHPSWQQVDEDGNPLPPEQLPVARVLATGKPVLGDVHGVRISNGDTRFISVNAMPLQNDGVTTGAIASLLDISARIEAERKLHMSEHLLHSSMDNMLEGCQILDHGWTYRYINRAAEIHNRRPSSELLGRRYADMWPGIEETEVYRAIERCLADRAATQMQNEFRFPDGGIGWFELSIQPVPEGVLILSTDITDRKRAEDKVVLYQEHLEKLVDVRTAELQAANEELDASNEELHTLNEELDATNEELMGVNEELDASNEELRDATAAKSQFLANMSHELRTPLNSIIGFSGLLSQGLVGELNEEQQKQVEMIGKSGVRLLELINDVLDLSRIEAHGVELHRTWFDAAGLVQDVADTLEPLALEKGLALEREVPDDPVMLYSDEAKIRQILLNFASNAIKFTPKGSVKMAVELNGKQLARLTVADTGIGISEKDLPRIFEPFSQINSDDTGKPHGTGLGLAISREFAQLLGGHIRADSTVGKGSAFTLEVPVQP